MSDRKDELIREEDRGWAELHTLLATLSPEDMERPTVTDDGWSVKDVLAHMASWWAEAGAELERMRMGTYERRKYNVDEMNARFSEANRDLDLSTVRAELHASRNRALEEFGKLDELTPPAHEWFYETGPCHYGEHLPDLRRFVEAATSHP